LSARSQLQPGLVSGRAIAFYLSVASLVGSWTAPDG
jgi:hypothetical protein